MNATETMTGLSIIEGIDLDAGVPCATIRCHDRGPAVADYLVRLAGVLADIAAEAFPICAECYEIGEEAAAAGGIAPAYRIVEVLR